MDTRTRWWEKSNGEPHEDLKLTVDNLQHEHDRREMHHKTWLNLYTNRQYSSFKPGEAEYALSLLEGMVGASGHAGILQGVKLNVIQSCIDTLSSKIAASRPRPQFLASDGEWDISSVPENLRSSWRGFSTSAKSMSTLAGYS